MTVASVFPEIRLGLPKFKLCQLTWARPFREQNVISRL